MLIKSMQALISKRDHFHIRFPIGKRFEVALWERPGNWCDDQTLSNIVQDLRAIANAGQGEKGVPNYGVLLGERNDLKTRVITIIYTKEKKHPVGFSALSYFDIQLGNQLESVLHLGLVFVDPEYQRQRLPGLLYGVAAFLLLFKNGLRSYWISNVTQVPAVVGLVSENYADIYPHYNQKNRQSFHHLILSRAIMKYHRSAFGVGEEAGFDEATQIITNAYTGGSDELKKTFIEAPKHRIPEVNQFCKTRLNYKRGDDFLQLGKCSLSSILGFLKTKLPQGSLVQLSFQASALFAFAVVAPIVRWLIPAQNEKIQESE